MSAAIEALLTMEPPPAATDKDNLRTNALGILPLYAWMTFHVTAVHPYPNDPA